LTIFLFILFGFLVSSWLSSSVSSLISQQS
jgi:hypothetical protein